MLEQAKSGTGVDDDARWQLDDDKDRTVKISLIALGKLLVACRL